MDPTTKPENPAFSDLESFLDSPHNTHEPMDIRTSEVFVGLYMGQQQGNPFKEPAVPPPVYQIIKQRLEWADDPISRVEPSVIIFCGLLSKGIPGICVQWAWTIHKLLRLYPDDTQIDLGVLSNHFAMGFPNDAERLRLWDAQKKLTVGGSDNWLDHREVWD